MSRFTLKDWITEPYQGIDWIEKLFESIDNYFDKTNGLWDSIEDIKIWDIDAISDEYILDLIAFSIGLWGWDKSWDLASKKAKLKIGVNLKRKAGTPYCIKLAPQFVLNPDKFNNTNNPVQLIEGYNNVIYNGKNVYDGSITYNAGSGDWWSFKLIIPYDGEPTAEELAAVTNIVERYKRLITHCVSIEIIPAQKKYLHAQVGINVDRTYVTIPHKSDLNFLTASTNEYALIGRIWFEGFKGTSNPVILAKSGTSQTPYKLFINGSGYNAKLALYLENSTSNATVEGIPLMPNKINSFVVVNKSGVVQFHQSYADYSGANLTIVNSSAVTTGVDNCSNTNDLTYLKGQQPWGYIKNFGGYDKNGTSFDPSIFLSETDFGNWDLKKVPSLIDDKGDPLLKPESPVFFHRLNEETGTIAKEFQGHTDLNGTITGATWDEFLMPYGAAINNILTNALYNFGMGENEESPVYKNNVDNTSNNLLVLENEYSKDWVVESRIDKGLSVVPSKLKVPNPLSGGATYLENSTLGGSALKADCAVLIDMDWAGCTADYCRILSSFSSVGRGFIFRKKTVSSNCILYYLHTTSSSTTVDTNTGLNIGTAERVIFSYRVNSNVVNIDWNNNNFSFTRAGNLYTTAGTPLNVFSYSSGTSHSFGTIRRMAIYTSGISSSDLTAFKNGTIPSGAAFWSIFDENTGTNIVDKSGNSNPFSIKQQAAPTVNFSWQGYVPKLEGAFSEQSEKTLTTPWVKGFWFKFEDLINNSDKILLNTLKDGAGLYVITKNNKIRVYFVSGANYWYIETSTISDTNPHLLAIQKNNTSASSGFKVFLDGVDQGAATTSGTIAAWAEDIAKPVFFEQTILNGTFYSAPELTYIESIFELKDILTTSEHVILYNRGYGLKFGEVE